MRAYATYENSRQQLAFEYAQLPTFKLNFIQTERQFNTGQVDGTTLRTAQLTLETAKNRVAVERLNQLRAEIELLWLTGGLRE